MSAQPYGAWRFLNPDMDEPDLTSGMQVTPSGEIAMVAGAESVRQALFLLLSTTPGERIMQPEYGCELHRLIFAPNDDTTAGLAIHYVRQAIARWEPRVDILRLDARRNPEVPERLDILLVYRVRAVGRTDSLALSMNLMGEG